MDRRWAAGVVSFNRAICVPRNNHIPNALYRLMTGGLSDGWMYDGEKTKHRNGLFQKLFSQKRR
jgi:hypothetical protein